MPTPANSASGLNAARVAVFGASHWHVPLYRDAIRRRHRVLVVQDHNPDAAADLGEYLGARATTSVADALWTDGIDLAYVFSPHDEMADVAGQLVERRIPFVLEKPGGACLAAVTALRDSARAAGVASAIAFVQRDGPIESWLKKVGEVAYERMSFIAGPPERYRRAGNDWMLDPERSGGGSIVNLGPHFIDLALRHIGPARNVLTGSSTRLHGEAVDDHTTLVVQNTGREAIIEVGYAFPDAVAKRYCSFSSSGSDGFASIDTDGRAVFTDQTGATQKAVIDVDSDDLYPIFVDHVADTLDSGFEGLAHLDDLVEAMTVIWEPNQPEGKHLD